LPLAFRVPIGSCRAAEPGPGERCACLSTWMCEFAPARSWRAAQGTARGFFRAARDWGVLLFGYFLLDKQEKVTRCAQRREGS
jgi:hypothetical protein